VVVLSRVPKNKLEEAMVISPGLFGHHTWDLHEAVPELRCSRIVAFVLLAPGRDERMMPANGGELNLAEVLC